MNEILQERVPLRRNRRNFRGVKRKMSNFPIRRRDRKALPPVDIGKAIRIVNPINRPISAHSHCDSSVRTIETILVRRLERRSRFLRGASGGNERRNISKAC